MNVLAERTARNAEIDNETSLPSATHSRRSADFEQWCLYSSWAACATCGQMLMRDLTEQSLRQVASPTVPAGQCYRCRSKRKLPKLSPEDVPEPLKNLTPRTQAALNIIDIDVGHEQRADGHSSYRQKVTMARFHWCKESCKD